MSVFKRKKFKGATSGSAFWQDQPAFRQQGFQRGDGGSVGKLQVALRATVDSGDIDAALSEAERLVESSSGMMPEGETLRHIIVALVRRARVDDATALLIRQRNALGPPTET